MDIRVMPATAHDLEAVAAIYDHEVRTGISTFDLEPPPLSRWERRLGSDEPGDHLLVARDGDEQVIGYGYSSAYRPRPAYARTRETSVYLAETARGRGIGRLLYDALLVMLRQDGVHTALAVVALPNPASEALHRSCGFRPVGTFREVGFKFGRWIDTRWYQVRLDQTRLDQTRLNQG
jgi:L-amino acid N-acyltransferase YncA